MVQQKHKPQIDTSPTSYVLCSCYTADSSTFRSSCRGKYDGSILPMRSAASAFGYIVPFVKAIRLATISAAGSSHPLPSSTSVGDPIAYPLSQTWILAFEIPTPAAVIIRCNPCSVRAEPEVLNESEIDEMGLGVWGNFVRAAVSSSKKVLTAMSKRDARRTSVLLVRLHVGFCFGVQLEKFFTTFWCVSVELHVYYRRSEGSSVPVQHFPAASW